MMPDANAAIEQAVLGLSGLFSLHLKDLPSNGHYGKDYSSFYFLTLGNVGDKTHR